MSEPTIHHRSLDDLNHAYSKLEAPPTEIGAVEMLVVRTNDGERAEVESATLSSAEGVSGDHWSRGGYADRPDIQVTLINSGVLDIIAGDRDRWALAGDNLVVDWDIGESNLPAGTRFEVGTAILEISEEPHTGCAKFSKRYGPDALRFVNLGQGPAMRFRGVYASVIRDGEVKTGDKVKKL